MEEVARTDDQRVLGARRPVNRRAVRLSRSFAWPVSLPSDRMPEVDVDDRIDREHVVETGSRRADDLADRSVFLERDLVPSKTSMVSAALAFRFSQTLADV